jgi:DNA-binding IclR family transcriptional regulator
MEIAMARGAASAVRQDGGDPGAPARQRRAGSRQTILERYATVLEATAGVPAGLSLTDISRGTGLPAATTYRLVAALRRAGFLAPRDGHKIYVLGPRLLRLMYSGLAPAAIDQLAQPLLEDLAARFKETAFIARLKGAQVESVAMAMPEGEHRAYVQPGRLMPFHAAASAKAILAHADDALLKAALAQPRRRFTEHTRTSAAELRQELAEVRRRGFAVCNQELDPGVLSYACPVHLRGAGPAAFYSIGIVGLTQRLTGRSVQEVVGPLTAAATELASLLESRLTQPTAAEAASSAAKEG